MRSYKPSKFKPDFGEFSRAEETILRSKLNGIRSAIKHPGEKGASADQEIMALLRAFLPSEYGLGSGFIVYHAIESVKSEEAIRNGAKVTSHSYHPEHDQLKVSTQLDIIIYDAVCGGPIVRLGSCDVFPLEVVYGYVEVKASIGLRKDRDKKTQIDKLFDQADELRQMKIKMYWQPISGTYTGAFCSVFPLKESISIRAYSVILDADAIGSRHDVEKQLQAAFSRHAGTETFLHGIYVNGKAFYRCVPQEAETTPSVRKIIMKDKSPLAEFKKALYIDLSRFPRTPQGWTIAIDKYLTQNGDGLNKSHLIEQGNVKRIAFGNFPDNYK